MTEQRITIPVDEVGEYFVARNKTLIRIVCNDMVSYPFKIIGLAKLTAGPNKGKERIIRYMSCGKSSEGPKFDLVRQLSMSEYLKQNLDTR